MGYHPVLKPYQNSTTQVVTAGTSATIFLLISETGVYLKSLSITTSATIQSVIIDGNITVTTASSVDLTQEFGDLVSVSQIEVVIDNTAGTVDDTVTVTANGIKKV